MISTELFPHENHPYRLEFGEKKNSTVCYFSCEEHLLKYLERYKLDKRTVKIDYRDGKPIKSGKTNKKSLQQTVETDNHRSGGGYRRNTKNLDTTGTVSRTRKSKK